MHGETSGGNLRLPALQAPPARECHSGPTATHYQPTGLDLCKDSQKPSIRDISCLQQMVHRSMQQLKHRALSNYPPTL